MRGNAITHQLSYGSVCSGIEAASVAWEPLGLRPAWFAEIEKFPSAVLAHHWPHVTNLGDMTKIAAAIRAGEVEAPDILVGGTPCQAFSIAGLRKGLSDARGQLTLAFVELANAIDDVRKAAGKPPCIIIWENVPGVLSSKDNAIGCFLAGIAGEDSELQPSGKRWTNSGGVYGPQRTVAWRILDAQYFGVAQRRRRVFVVASARTDIDPTQILFESDGVRRDIAPSRGAGAETSRVAGNGVKVGSHWDNPANPHPTLNQSHNVGGIGQSNQELFSQRGSGIIAMAHGQAGAEIKTDNSAPTLTCNHEAPIVLHSNDHASFAPCLNTLRAKSGADNETLAVHGTQDPDTLNNLAHTLGRNHGQENAVIAFSSKDNGQDATTELSPTIRAGGHGASHANAGAPPAVIYPAIALQTDVTPKYSVELAFTLKLPSSSGGGQPAATMTPSMAVRRLTPRECERLQGFPDDHTLVPFGRVIRPEKLGADYAKYLMRGGRLGFEECCRAAADGPRYKAIGNSMAVPVMRWIMTRIAQTLDHQQRTDKMTDTAVPVKKRASKKAASDKPERNKPFLKWAGGKFSQLDQILPLIGTGDRLIEPFVGAGSIFLNAPGFNSYILSDSSTDLISLYLALQAAPGMVTDKARQMFASGNTEDAFMGIRTRFNSIRYTPYERAAAFLYLNRHSFNGLMRYNLKGEYNVGFGKYKAPYFPEEELADFAAMAPRCEFVCRSFVDTIRLAGEGDVLFCDPPYMSLPDTSGFTQYTKVPFTDEHQWQLLNEMVAAHQRGARVIVTNSGHPALIEAYKKAGFRVRELFARRSMSCKGDKREVAVDLVGVLE
ncbi:Dam family site-specific DNA-(adenine-N6)-methyltransferase [Enterobacter hormaechei subsp. hoffmannii]|nr:Dam family site-specific DNA-(adenine-N6)-methyltransferase [Enterobacter hormaechei subsp. hoffmannii]